MIFDCVEFDWNAGNSDKNWHKHQVSKIECEEIFFNQPIFIQEDSGHSQQEKRYYALGKTNVERRLFISFTLRNGKIRVISARDMSRKERRVYVQEDSEV